MWGTRSTEVNRSQHQPTEDGLKQRASSAALPLLLEEAEIYKSKDSVSTQETFF